MTFTPSLSAKEGLDHLAKVRAVAIEIATYEGPTHLTKAFSLRASS
ncbi:hypothetical protein MUG78_00130 [Gordonia alkaliphila]|uniref:Uncharacterized protein n=1 Tax=Gordonia alkaliphila TaxID=1053547 RepID=A0ABP8ZEA6_9ACTN|nr:hypothetical protein [Gordonia alkaliphila]MCK0437906.1 hypothetical protein [Gordonia alkaliphila]